jgi:hypothetical protein
MWLPEGYKQSKRKVKEWGRAQTGRVSPRGTAEVWEHWDGSRDVTVKPKAFGVRVRSQGMDLVAELAELEAAIRENELALRSGDAGWHRRTARRVNRAKQALQVKAG